MPNNSPVFSCKFCLCYKKFIQNVLPPSMQTLGGGNSRVYKHHKKERSCAMKMISLEPVPLNVHK